VIDTAGVFSFFLKKLLPAIAVVDFLCLVSTELISLMETSSKAHGTIGSWITALSFLAALVSLAAILIVAMYSVSIKLRQPEWQKAQIAALCMVAGYIIWISYQVLDVYRGGGF
jgi:predicted neutral ceramidase superfamily lipid hydrolase